MKRWIWLAAIVLVLLGAVLVWAGWDESFFDEAKIWSSLEGSIGKLEGAPRDGFAPDWWKTCELDGKIVIGHVGFARRRDLAICVRLPSLRAGDREFQLI